MKKIKVLVLLSLIMMLFGLAACSSPTSSGSSKSEVAVYKGTSPSKKGATYDVTITCYSDNTFTIHEYNVKQMLWIKAVTNLDIYSGTYTGDPSKDGTVKIHATKMADVNAVNKYLDDVGLDTTYIEITNAQGPLIDIPAEGQVEQTYEIVNGEFELRVPDTTIDKTKVKRQ